MSATPIIAQGLISLQCKGFLGIKKKKMNCPRDKWTQDWDSTGRKKQHWEAEGLIRRHSPSLTHSKTYLSQNDTRIPFFAYQIGDNPKGWRHDLLVRLLCWGTGTLRCCWWE